MPRDYSNLKKYRLNDWTYQLLTDVKEDIARNFETKITYNDVIKIMLDSFKEDYSKLTFNDVFYGRVPRLGLTFGEHTVWVKNDTWCRIDKICQDINLSYDDSISIVIACYMVKHYNWETYTSPKCVGLYARPSEIDEDEDDLFEPNEDVDVQRGHW